MSASRHALFVDLEDVSPEALALLRRVARDEVAFRDAGEFDNLDLDDVCEELLDADPDLVSAVAVKLQRRKRFGVSREEAWCLAALLECAVSRLDALSRADLEEDIHELGAVAATLKRREAA